MKTPRFLKTLVVVLLSMFSSFISASDLLHLDEWKWGDATNDIVAGVHLARILGRPNDLSVELYLHESFSSNAPPPTFRSEPDPRSGPNPFRDKGLFHATNWFRGGQLELRDQAGSMVPLLKPLGDFPPNYRPGQLGADGPLKRRLAVPILGRLPRLESFEPKDIFAIKEPGEYRLTIWPKVYKRRSEVDDLCERIDLPVLSIVFKYQFNPRASNSPSRRDSVR